MKLDLQKKSALIQQRADFPNFAIPTHTRTQTRPPPWIKNKDVNARARVRVKKKPGEKFLQIFNYVRWIGERVETLSDGCLEDVVDFSLHRFLAIFSSVCYLPLSRLAKECCAKLMTLKVTTISTNHS